MNGRNTKKSKLALIEGLLLVALVLAILFLWGWRSRTNEQDRPDDQVAEQSSDWGEVTAGITKENIEEAPVFFEEKEEFPEVQAVFLPFESYSAGLPVGGEWRGDPAVGDFNRDGLLDIVASLRMLKKFKKEGEVDVPIPLS